MSARPSLRMLLGVLGGAVIGASGHAAWSAAHRARLPAGGTLASLTSAPACEPGWDLIRRAPGTTSREVAGKDTTGIAGSGAASPIPSRPPVAEETEDNREARATETALLERAIHAGRWTDDDVHELRALLPRMGAADRAHALTGVVQAINQRRFRLEASVPF